MPGDDLAYHQRRAEKQRLLATRCTDPAVAKVHLALAALHDERAQLPAGSRAKLHMVMPGA